MENNSCVQEDKDSEEQAKKLLVQQQQQVEEYVLLDLGKVSAGPNAPYVLSGLDTPNPILIIDNKIKLVGEYVETVGTCLVFEELDVGPVVHEETGPSEADIFSGIKTMNPRQTSTKQEEMWPSEAYPFIGIKTMDPRQTSAKQVKPLACLHKVLRFRPLLLEDGSD